MNDVINIVMIEDDWTAYRQLSAMVKAYWQAAHIYPQLPGIEQAASFFSQGFKYDLVFADLELQDGSSFDLWRTHPPGVPIIYTTAFKHYWSRALQNNGIDYLLKPIEETELHIALDKYRSLQHHFAKPPSLATAGNATGNEMLHHVIIKSGVDFQLIAVDEIVALYSHNKVVYLITSNNKKYICHEVNLSRLAEQLDKDMFFKASRKFVINIRYISKFHSEEQSRIALEMESSLLPPIRLSQENANAFRKWVGQR